MPFQAYFVKQGKDLVEVLANLMPDQVPNKGDYILEIAHDMKPRPHEEEIALHDVDLATLLRTRSSVGPPALRAGGLQFYYQE